MQIDWGQLAQELGCVGCVSNRDALRALEAIIGEDAIREAIEHYIAGGPGAELARFVLWQLHPRSGMEYLYKIFKDDPDGDRRAWAIELLRVVADKSVIPWISQFLADDDEGIQNLGASVLDHLTWKCLANEEDCGATLQLMKHHANPGVREKYASITGLFAHRRRADRAVEDLIDDEFDEPV